MQAAGGQSYQLKRYQRDVSKPLEVNSYAGIQAVIAETIRDVRENLVRPQVGSAVAALCATALRCLNQSRERTPYEPQATELEGMSEKDLLEATEKELAKLRAVK